jgi:hypothetical protein
VAATLRLCAKADSGSDGTEGERCHARMLHDRRFTCLIDKDEDKARGIPTGTDALGPMHH